VANAIGHAERGTNACIREISAEGAGNTREVLRGDVGLTAEIKLAPGFGLQADSCLATEHATALAGFAGAQSKTVFQNENSLQTITQIFGAFQAPTVARLATAEHASARTFVIGAVDRALNPLVSDAAVDDTVEGDRGFGLSDTGKASDQSSN